MLSEQFKRKWDALEHLGQFQCSARASLEVIQYWIVPDKISDLKFALIKKEFQSDLRLVKIVVPDCNCWFKVQQQIL